MPYKINKPSTIDIDSIYQIIKYYADKEIILHRDKSDIQNSIDQFLVLKIKDEIAGVISYYDYGEDLKEIRSLSIKKEFLRKGIGSILLEKLVQKILELKKPKIFVLTYTPDFFLSNDFIEVPHETLPEKIWKDCSNCKNRDNCNETALIYSVNSL